MSGIVNSTGAKSGIIGTTVGTPSSAVLQVVSVGASVSQTSTTGGVGNWALKAVPLVSLVTKGTNSKILVAGNITVHNGGGANMVCLDYRRTITGGATTDNISGESYGLAIKGSAAYDNWHISFLDSPNVAIGVTVSYQYVFRNESGSTTHYLGHDSVNNTITLSEIAV